MQDGRGSLKGLYRIKHGVEVFIVNLNTLNGLFGYSLALSGNRCHLFADEANHALGQNGHVVDLPADSKTGQIMSRHHGLDTRDFSGSADIDSLNPAVRYRTSKDLTPERSAGQDVHGINCLPGDLLYPFNSRDGLANNSSGSHRLDPQAIRINHIARRNILASDPTPPS